MAKNRKRSPSERVRQKHLASSAPQGAPSASAPAPLHVAPLAPPPVFAERLPRLILVPDPAPSSPEADGPEPSADSRRVEQSLAPVTATPDLDDDMEAATPAPAARWKRGMALVAAFAACAGIAIGLKIMRPRSAPPVTARPALAAQVVEPSPSLAPPPPPPVEPIAEPIAPAPSVSATASATAVAPASEAAASAATLRDEALDLLKKAKNPEAMATASAALEADPTDAMPYLVLGSALQDAGRWREAHRAYELCVKNAKHGMVDECRAMLRAR